MGDARRFSPFYGQGISLACSDAAALDRCVQRGPANLTARVHRQIARATVWMCQHHAGSDSTVYTAFLRLINPVGSPLALLRPDVIWRVLRVQPAHSAASSVTDREPSLAAPPVESA